MLLCFYDTETTGKPNWKEPSDSPTQPHLVELAAVLVDSETREIVDRLHHIIKPDGWIIEDDVIAIHGITNERAHAEGYPESFATVAFSNFHARAGKRIGHSEQFDARIMRIAHKRYLGAEMADEFKAAPAECTCWLARPVCAIPNPGKRSGIKLPTLSEAYLSLTGKPHDGAHGAMADTLACMEVYFALLDKAAPADGIPPTTDAEIPLGL